ncbi:hypothetical protein ACROYT_G020779 [Oculina patagonica]
MSELQNTQEIAANDASIPLKSAEIALADSHHEGENAQEKGTSAGQQQRQPRTRFSSIQRYELERAFNQSNYITPHSFNMLQKLGIPKRTIMVWFKNRRVKLRKKTLSKACSSREHLKPAASSTPVISTHQSSILQGANCDVQNTRMEGENWPYCSTRGIYTDSLGCTGISLFKTAKCIDNGNTWSRCETSTMCKYLSHTPSSRSINTTALSYGSSGMSQTQLSSHSNVPWLDNTQGLAASLPFIHQGDQRVPEELEDPGQQLCDRRDRTHPSALEKVHQLEETTSHSTAPDVNDLEYSSLLDDLLDVLQSDLATQNNIFKQ